MSTPEKDLHLQTTTLIGRAKRGDGEAISALYLLYEKRLKAAIKNRVSTKLQARLEENDLIQSVWKDVLSGMDDFDYRGPDSFYRWLLTRLIRKIQDKGRYFAAGKRDMKREERVPQGRTSLGGIFSSPDPGPSPSQVAMADEELDRILRLLGRLPNTQRQVLVLRLKDGKEFEEIARFLDKSTEAVRKLYSRALMRMGQLMEEVKGEPPPPNLSLT